MNDPIKINFFQPHAKQLEVIKYLEDPTVTFVTVVAGRRFGKSALNLNVGTKFALDNKNIIVLYIVPSADQRKVLFDEWCRFFEKGPFLQNIDRTFMDITLKNGSVLKFRIGSFPSAESLRGNRFDMLIIDEASQIEEELYTEILMATMATSTIAPKVLFTTTPRSNDWIYGMYMKGIDESKPEYRSVHAPSSASPYVNQEFLNLMKSELPELVYRQEIDAEFISSSGALFSNITTNLSPNGKVYHPNSQEEYYAGVDLAIISDQSVVTIIDSKGNIVDYIRFNQVTMKEAASRIFNILKKWNFPMCQIEINAYQGIFELLRDMDCENIYPFVTTTKSKKTIIEDLIVIFQNNEIKLVNDKYFISEFIDFGYVYNSKTRNISYKAQKNSNDDIVMSCAIAFNSKKKLGNFSCSWL